MDAEEALNVVRVRLTRFEGVETDDPNELVVGVRGGRPDATGAVGSTTTTILAETSRPVLVVPLEW